MLIITLIPSLTKIISFSQIFDNPAHTHKHTLDPLTYGLEISDLKIHPQNAMLSGHFLITFQFSLEEYVAPNDRRRDLSVLSADL